MLGVTTRSLAFTEWHDYSYRLVIRDSVLTQLPFGWTLGSYRPRSTNISDSALKNASLKSSLVLALKTVPRILPHSRTDVRRPNEAVPDGLSIRYDKSIKKQ